jgi:hypothetical protein
MIESRDTVFVLRWKIWAIYESAFQYCGLVADYLSAARLVQSRLYRFSEFRIDHSDCVTPITQASDYNNSGKLMCKWNRETSRSSSQSGQPLDQHSAVSPGSFPE